MRHGTAEVVVVGAGIVGLSAAQALAERGVDFRLFEAGRPGAGQSAGRTRIFRHGHARPELVRLVAESRRVWEGWERRSGARLLGREGVLVTGPEATRRAALLSQAGVPHRLVGRAEQEQALPIFRAPEGEALLDELGGSTDVRASVDALTAAVGDRLVTAQVFRLDEGVLETSEGIWDAERVIVCAGARVRELTDPIGLEIPISVACHARARFAVREAHAGRPLASLQDLSGAHGEVVYGGPVPGGRTYVVGLAGPDGEVPVGQGGVDELVRRISGYVERALPGLDPDPVDVRLCLTTQLPEGGDTFRVWRHRSILVLAGDNLFKFGPVLGRLLAGAARDEPLPAWLDARGRAGSSTLSEQT